MGGYGLYVRDGKPTFVYNDLALDRFTFTGREPLPKGKVQLTVDFAYKGGAGERGKGAAVAMMVNGTKVAGGEMPRPSRCRSRWAKAWTSARTSAPRWTSLTSCRSRSRAQSTR